MYMYIYTAFCIELPWAVKGHNLRTSPSSKMNRRAEFWCGCGTNGKAYSDDKPQVLFRAPRHTARA